MKQFDQPKAIKTICRPGVLPRCGNCNPLIPLLISMMFLMMLAACGGGGSGDNDDPDTGINNTSSFSSYMMPSEISAVPTKNLLDSQGLGHSVFSSLFRALYTDDGTDYTQAKTRKYVEERTLEQFDVLSDVLSALNQTRYYQEVGNPAYKAIVTQVGGDGNQESKSLETWVVESDIVTDTGQVVEPNDVVAGVAYNVRVRAWIQEPQILIKAQFVIVEEPLQNPDGTYDHYGEWNLNVKFGDSEDEYFVASCEIGPSGESIIQIHEIFGEEGPGSGGLEAEIKAIMRRSQNQGYGQVSYPDWEAVYGPDAQEGLTAIPVVTALYAYNDDYLAIKDGNTDTRYKDRNQMVEMTHQYGVFETLTGNDIMRTQHFGFPIRFTDLEGINRHGYYGAWQGRHQLWLNGPEGGDNSLDEGTTVYEENFDSATTPQAYTVGETFDGVLVKRSYQNASLDDIKNIPVEIWINNNYQLIFNPDEAAWYHCGEMTWDDSGPSCAQDPVDFGAEIGFSVLANQGGDSRKQVNINGWDQVSQVNKRFVYLMASNEYSVAAGFYEAEEVFGEYGPVMTLILAGEQPIPLNPNVVNQLWVWIGGSIYVEYRGVDVGWVEKELLSFDYDHWKPEFGETETSFTLPESHELYINMDGANYVVQKNSQGNITVQLELQTAFNPLNSEELLPDGTVLQEPWNDNGTTYEFVTNPSADNYLLLVYKTVAEGAQDMNGNTVSAGDVVLEGKWGLEAEIDGETQAFNWEYSEEGWSRVTYLMLDDIFVILDDPVRFDPITIDVNGSDKTLVLQFDGWMMGLPDMYNLLYQNDYVMTTEISEKVINLEAGTAVVDSATGSQYVLKPLEISQFLLPAAEDTDSSTLPDIEPANNVNLDAVPEYVEHNMPDTPSVDIVKYSEGIPVE